MNETTIRFLNGEAGEELMSFFENELLEMRDIKNVADLQTAASQALEVKARMRACKKLEEIVGKLRGFASKTERAEKRGEYSTEA